ncbi:cell division protein DamX [Salmonella enterica subsp. enterica serovar Saintpaul]|uniref:Cell division protein DamX n=1 Tax=Salmonella enterica subsp. enterica serovar Saintpaul TaxID=90105 RepID=A0A5W1U911_SALET|nr:cell division protein DamX [Salmonella enterica subsp. enterica]EBV9448713.1 cell division protein DamX [Salmonella enterica subsp. enterica serovar Saintpaul]EDN1306779.1 cell division protein DamX [Salmonella enterica subsp. enterica serovar Virchow]EBW2401050.1 cell division protein DamX [Salmonella enterica subsp. enterica serovar Saintpaul]EDN5209768.1 cell division protein DamX [Salmonella enterica subsp. enterica serovar Saintpaul]
MDEFKPEDELKPDPSDRRTGRSRQSSERDNEPQINFDDVDLDADDRRPTRTRKARSEEPEVEEEYESDEDDTVDEERVERRPRKRKKATHKPASRQYMMMGVGVLVLLLLIIGIGSALKAPSTSSSEPSASGEKSIDLSGNAADQANATQPAPGATSAEQTAGNTSQDISLPPISSTPTQGQSPVVADGQQRVEVQGDLNNALTQNPEQMNNVAVNSTLPTEPATVAPVRNGSTTRQAAVSEPAERHTTRPERKQAVIEPKKPQATAKTTTAEPKKPVAPVKRTEPAAPVATPKATTTTASAAPVQTAKPAQASTTPVAGGGKSAGNVGALKSAPSSHYTLQLSSSSNYDNLNGWAKKENLKNYVVYETTRNGQPWYVLVTGMYASKEDAKRAVSTLPADVQAKNPWAKPLHQVQADLK